MYYLLMGQIHIQGKTYIKTKKTFAKNKTAKIWPHVQ